MLPRELAEIAIPEIGDRDDLEAGNDGDKIIEGSPVPDLARDENVGLEIFENVLSDGEVGLFHLGRDINHLFAGKPFNVPRDNPDRVGGGGEGPAEQADPEEKCAENKGWGAGENHDVRVFPKEAE